AFLLIGLTTVVAVRASALDRLDEQVLAGLDMAVGPDGPQEADGRPPGPGDESERPPPRVGTLHVLIQDDGSVLASAYTDGTGSTIPLTSTQIGVLTSAEASPRSPVTVDLGGTIGALRIAVEDRGGVTVIAG